jgi:multidrug resistance protein, MATE family
MGCKPPTGLPKASRCIPNRSFPMSMTIPSELHRQERQAIIRQALPVLVAQLASMGMMVIDTLLLGHYGALDLAAIAVGGGLYISVVFALVGILQALGPIAAHHVGAGRIDQAIGAFWQGIWLALLLSVPGTALLVWPDPLLALSPLEPAVEARVREVLRLLAAGVPVALLYRTFAAYTNALGRARVLMAISLAGTTLHAVLATQLVHGVGPLAPMGALGCAVSTAIVNAFGLSAAALHLARGGAGPAHAVFRHVAAPDLRRFGEFFRLGVPMGLSNFIEITSFTLIALFVAPLGAEVVAGHRIVGNLAAIAYMVPLSIAIATLARVGQAAGARDPQRVRAATRAGMMLAMAISSVVGAAIALGAKSLVSAFSEDAAVLAVGLSLVGFVAVYQLFDAFQTVAGYALRGLKVTLAPMLVHLVAFWGVGLGAGAWLAYPYGMGAPGFWLASVFSTVAASIAFGIMLRQALRTAA